MDKPFIAIDTMDKFKTLKIASSEDNTSYIHYGTTEMPGVWHSRDSMESTMFYRGHRLYICKRKAIC